MGVDLRGNGNSFGISEVEEKSRAWPIALVAIQVRQKEVNGGARG